jgi:hypothetical protein
MVAPIGWCLSSALGGLSLHLLDATTTPPPLPSLLPPLSYLVLMWH